MNEFTKLTKFDETWQNLLQIGQDFGTSWPIFCKRFESILTKFDQHLSTLSPRLSFSPCPPLPLVNFLAKNTKWIASRLRWALFGQSTFSAVASTNQVSEQLKKSAQKANATNSGAQNVAVRTHHTCG